MSERGNWLFVSGDGMVSINRVDDGELELGVKLEVGNELEEFGCCVYKLFCPHYHNQELELHYNAPLMSKP